MINASTVTVIIGAYNGKSFIQDAIRSVVNQTFEDWKLIIVDDGSTDETYLKAKEVRDDRISLIRLDKNSGSCGLPRNVGIRASKGEFVAFLDADDIWMPEKLQMQLSAFRQDPETGFVYTKYIRFDDKGDIGSQFFLRGYSGRLFKNLLRRNFIAPSTVMVKKEVLENVGYFTEDRTLIGSEDYELWLRLAYYYRAAFIDKILMKYRLHPSSVSLLQRDGIHERQIKVLESAFSKLNVPEKHQKAALSHHYAVMGRAYLKMQKYDLFEKYTLQSLQLDLNFKAALALFFFQILGTRKFGVCVKRFQKDV